MGEAPFSCLCFDTSRIQIKSQLGYLTFFGKLSNSKQRLIFKFPLKQEENKIEPEKFFAGLKSITDLWSPSLVPILYACYSEQRKQFILATKVYRKGTLEDFFYSNDYKKKTKKNATIRAKAILGLAHGIAQVHKRGIAHDCIQPSRVFLDDKYQPHLSDNWITDTKQDIKYLPPEVMVGGKEYDHQAADIFAFALIFYHLISQTLPFETINKTNIGPLVYKGARPALPPRASQMSKNLLTQCWHQDPKQRPSAQTILETLLQNFDEIIPEADKQEMMDYATMLMKFPMMTLLAKKGNPKSKQKLSNYLKSIGANKASDFYDPNKPKEEQERKPAIKMEKISKPEEPKDISIEPEKPKSKPPSKKSSNAKTSSKKKKSTGKKPQKTKEPPQQEDEPSKEETSKEVPLKESNEQEQKPKEQIQNSSNQNDDFKQQSISQNTSSQSSSYSSEEEDIEENIADDIEYAPDRPNSRPNLSLTPTAVVEDLHPSFYGDYQEPSDFQFTPMSSPKTSKAMESVISDASVPFLYQPVIVNGQMMMKVVPVSEATSPRTSKASNREMIELMEGSLLWKSKSRPSVC